MCQSSDSSTPFTFKPLSQIKQALCAVHPYAHDPSRVVPAFHYCTHNSTADLHQCLVFDSNEPGARLIGIEYIVSEDVFKGLDEEEKKYWHSHKYEIESGLLTMVAKPGITGPVGESDEMPALKDLHSTYGKTFHFWEFDLGHKLPLGPPRLMKALNSDAELTPTVISGHEARTGTNVQKRKEYRAAHLNLDSKVAEGADQKGPQLELCFRG